MSGWYEFGDSPHEYQQSLMLEAGESKANLVEFGHMTLEIFSDSAHRCL